MNAHNCSDADTSHLVAIHARLCRQRAKLAAAAPGNRALLLVHVQQTERELAAERGLL